VQEVKIEGIRELNADLRRLPGQFREKALRTAIRRGSAVIQRKAKQKVPKRTGRLAESITTTVRFQNLFDVTAEIGPKSAFKFLKVESLLGTMKSVVATGWYAHFVEFGHVMKARGKVIGNIAAKPFLRPAVDESFEEVVSIVIQELDKNIAKFNKKLLK